MIEICIVPERGWRSSSCVEKLRVLRVGDLRGGELKSVNPDTVDGAFAVLSGVRAHQEPGGGNLDHYWFEQGRFQRARANL